MNEKSGVDFTNSQKYLNSEGKPIEVRPIDSKSKDSIKIGMINQWSETELKYNGMSSHDISIPNFQLATGMSPAKQVTYANVKLKKPMHKRD